MNYQYGGWYTNPATGKNQRWFNGVWTDGPEPGAGGSDPLSLYNQYSSDLNNNLNNYTNQQEGFSQKSHDLTAGNLTTQNINALGTQDQASRDAFLNGILDPMQKQEGSLQYGYNLNVNHENQDYGINSNYLTSNRQLALNKLATDEKNQLAQVALSQGNQNESTIENLNQRGLLYGQTPTGGFQGTAMGGMQGIAGQQAGLVNQDFSNQRNNVVDPYNYNVNQTNLDYNKNQGLLDSDHQFTLKNAAFNTSNDVLDQNRNFNYQMGENDNQLAMAKAAAEQQKAQQAIQNKITAQSIGARQGGISY